MSDLRQTATRRIGTLLEKRARLDEQIDSYSTPIEAAAHDILKARRAYSRSGQYPQIRYDDDWDDRPVTEEGVKFHVSNGRDRDDDFTVTLTWEELEADPEEVTRHEDDKRRREEINRARERVRNAERQLERLEKGTG